AQINRARPPNPPPRRQEWRDHTPLRILHIACVAPPITAIVRTGDFSPAHVENSFVASQPRRNHNGLKSLNLLFRPASQVHLAIVVRPARLRNVARNRETTGMPQASGTDRDAVEL